MHTGSWKVLGVKMLKLVEKVLQRNTDATAQAILDAARSCILYGGANPSITDIAKKAGISRPTVYKRYRNVTEITADVLTQELLELLDIEDIPDNGPLFVRYIVQMAAKVRDNALLQIIINEEPDLLLTYQFERLGRSQLAIIDVLAYLIERVPGINKENPLHKAVFVLIAVQSAALSARIVSGFIDEESWERELTQILEGYLIK